jgi:hypothetical protein
MFNSDYNTDNEYEEYDDVVYGPEEKSLTRYNIILCELYNEKIHGIDDSCVLYNYLVHSRFKYLNMDCINEILVFIQNKYINLPNKRHHIYKNYMNIIKNNYIKPEIGECIYLNSGHCVTILKTFWIKIIQKTWKNILKKRENIIKKKCNINSLKYRETDNKRSVDYYNYPTLKGMLHKLKT